MFKTPTQRGSLAGLLVLQGCGLFGGTLDHPGVSQDSLDGEPVHGVVLQQPGNQVFGSGTDIGLSRVSVLHLDNKDRDSTLNDLTKQAL